MTPRTPGGTRLDRLGDAEARDLLESCLAAPGWVEGMLAGRPYVDRAELLARGRELASRLTEDDVHAALARHPRIAEKPAAGHDAELSSAEQSGVDEADRATVDAIRAGNAAYEERFGRVFLIRAAGRSSEEILDALHRRLRSSPEDEDREVAGQLAEIALLRLAQLVPEEQVTSHGSTVSTHVLDAARGGPGAGIGVVLERLSDPAGQVAAAVTDEDGRVPVLGAAVPAGTYRLSLDTAAYFAATGTASFFPRVDVVFVTDGDTGHFHVPVLLSPYSFTTYRGT